MKKLKYVLLIVLLLISFNVKAAETCENTEFKRLKELAKKIEFDYDYKVENGIANFSINAVNLTNDLRVLIINNFYTNDFKEFKGSTEGTLSGFKSGDKVEITIKGFVPNPCSGVTVLTKVIRLPYYNVFYNEEECKGNEDFKYCKLLLSKNITEAEYQSAFNLYLKNKDKKSEEKTVPIEINKDVYIIIVGVVLVIVITTLLIISIVKRRKKYKL